MQHILSAEQFDRKQLDNFFARAKKMERVAAKGGSNALKGKILATLFYEPSTRTRLSFEAAMLKLGGQVISMENAILSSSFAKSGETIEDTIRIVNNLADVIVLRHPQQGTAQRAAAVSRAPLINAGDGPGEHPTQSLLDLYTIQKEVGKIDGIKIAFAGDLKFGRTARSLAKFLTFYNAIEMVFVSPSSLRFGADVIEKVQERGFKYRETERLDEVLTEVDILYIARVQQERFTDKNEYDSLKDVYRLTQEQVKRMRPEARVMHALPRVNEIAPDVDGDPRAAYFRQARNGLFVRMALLDLLCHSRPVSRYGVNSSGNPE